VLGHIRGHIVLTQFLVSGIRKAVLSDVDDVQALLLPLEKEGVLVKRSRHELEAMMKDFIVIERENKVRIQDHSTHFLSFIVLCCFVA
jgi:N-acetylglutamate synthase-like GNAT family acetyltransferase